MDFVLYGDGPFFLDVFLYGLCGTGAYGRNIPTHIDFDVIYDDVGTEIE